MKGKATVIYILSNQRSGSTLLENILSKSPQMTSVGELFLLDGHIHKRGPGYAWDWNCSCDKSFTECDFWDKVFEKLQINDPKEIQNTKILPPNGKNSKSIKSTNDETKSLINKIYAAVSKISGNNIIVDSSKEPFNGTNLYFNSPYNFKFIYLKRDLRAVTISKYKWRKKDGKKKVGHLKLLLANYHHRIKSWFLLRSVRKKDVYKLKYEDFFEEPQKKLDEMADFFGFDSFEMPTHMELKNDHTIAGTPNRFQKREIKYDDRWLDLSKKKPVFNFLGLILNRLG